MPEHQKVILTNHRRLRDKYRRTGADRVERAIQRLIRADEDRGIHSLLVYLDDRDQMRELGARAVTNASSAQQNKRAVDEVNAAIDPDYLLILGAPDVIPHQILRNPIGGGGGDDDLNVPSDLPYACEAEFGRKIEDFIAPSRVVGRIPNVQGDESPNYLLRLLLTARRWEQRPRSVYERGFVLTADVWKGSTHASARKLFGTSSDVRLAPPKAPPWSEAGLGRRAHFINCHGANSDFHFYGESGSGDFPVAHQSDRLRGVREGTVATAECCYGAELYDPDEVDAEPGIANSYLDGEAYGFFGSTNIAYGPPDGNGAADLICRYFLRNVQQGSSIGRAALEARQEFVRKNEPLNPVDLKTVGQFYLLGDPSIHPARRSTGTSLPGSKSSENALKRTRENRRRRRRRLESTANRLAESSRVTLSVPDRTRKRVIHERMKSFAAKVGAMEGSEVRVFDVREPRKTNGSGAPITRVRSKGLAFLLMIEPKGSARSKQKAMAAGGARIKTRRIVLATERNGKIESTREYLPR